MAASKSAPPVITIDGPSGTGKGTVASMLADALQWHILDSGALYRAVGHLAATQKIDPTDEAALSVLVKEADIQFGRSEEGVLILVDEVDVTDLLRSEAGGAAASVYAAIPAVRTALLDRQRAARVAPGLIADGRDMGTVVFPDALLKIFLVATPKVRAQRRYKQLKEKGFDVNLPRLEKEIAERDFKDTHRKASPLAPAGDAIVLDTSEKSRNEVLTEVLELVDARVK